MDREEQLKLVKTLNKKQRIILIYRYHDNLEFQEIAIRMKISLTRAFKLMEKAKKELAKNNIVIEDNHYFAKKKVMVRHYSNDSIDGMIQGSSGFKCVSSGLGRRLED